MKNLKLMSMLMLFIMLFSFSVSAEWYMNSNSNYAIINQLNEDSTDLSSQFSAYSVLAPTYVNLNQTETNYCQASGSLYTPVSADFDDDGLDEYVISTTNEILLYNTKCEIIASYPIETALNSAPMITYWNDNVYPDLVFQDGENFTFIEYSTQFKDFIYLTSFDTNNPNLKYGFCVEPYYYNDLYCIGVNSVSVSGLISETQVYRYKFNKSTKNITDTSILNFLTGSTSGREYIRPATYTGFSFKRTNQISKFAMYGRSQDTSSYVRILDQNLNVLTSIALPSGTTATTSNIYLTEVGGTEIVIFKTDGNIYNRVYTTSGTLLINQDGTATSNWITTDINKDGTTELCRFKQAGSTEFQCYDSSGNPILDRYDIDDNIFFGNNLVSFDASSDLNSMAIATIEGINYVDLAGSTQTQLYDSGIATASYNGYCMATRHSSVRVPSYVYSDSTNTYIFNYFQYLGFCGDGECGSNENGVSCPLDCDPSVLPDDNETEETSSYGTGDGQGEVFTPCVDGADCQTGVCEYNQCGYIINQDYECSQDSDCLSGNCIEKYCTDPSLVQKLAYSKDQQFGSDTATTNFISLALSIAIGGSVAMGTGGGLGVALGFFISIALLILFAVIGWLSGWILFVILLLLVVVLVVIALIKARGE